MECGLPNANTYTYRHIEEKKLVQERAGYEDLA